MQMNSKTSNYYELKSKKFLSQILINPRLALNMLNLFYALQIKILKTFSKEKFKDEELDNIYVYQSGIIRLLLKVKELDRLANRAPELPSRLYTPTHPEYIEHINWNDCIKQAVVFHSEIESELKLIKGDNFRLPPFVYRTKSLLNNKIANYEDYNFFVSTLVNICKDFKETTEEKEISKRKIYSYGKLVAYEDGSINQSVANRKFTPQLEKIHKYLIKYYGEWKEFQTIKRFLSSKANLLNIRKRISELNDYLVEVAGIKGKDIIEIKNNQCRLKNESLEKIRQSSN